MFFETSPTSAPAGYEVAASFALSASGSILRRARGWTRRFLSLQPLRQLGARRLDEHPNVAIPRQYICTISFGSCNRPLQAAAHPTSAFWSGLPSITSSQQLSVRFSTPYLSLGSFSKLRPRGEWRMEHRETDELPLLTRLGSRFGMHSPFPGAVHV